ncbi:MAG: hypothetical protein Q9195_007784 [Heterodermia aff. obscurata]
MARVRLNEAIQLDRLKSIVPIDNLDIVVFGENKKNSIATQNLNSCHTVAIVSRKAALLAHIAPGPPAGAHFAPFLPANQQQDLTPGDLWVRSKIGELLNTFERKKVHFENEGSVGVLVFGLHQGKTALPDQVKYIIERVEKVTKAPVMTKSYYGLGRTENRSFNKSVVLIEQFATGQLPRVWVEDDLVPLLPAPSSSTGSTAVASSSR